MLTFLLYKIKLCNDFIFSEYEDLALFCLCLPIIVVLDLLFILFQPIFIILYLKKRKDLY